MKIGFNVDCDLSRDVSAKDARRHCVGVPQSHAATGDSGSYTEILRSSGGIKRNGDCTKSFSPELFCKENDTGANEEVNFKYSAKHILKNIQKIENILNLGNYTKWQKIDETVKVKLWSVPNNYFALWSCP